MSKQQEALRLALDALEEIHPGNMTPMAEGNWNKAITAIKEALAQPKTVNQFNPDYSDEAINEMTLMIKYQAMLIDELADQVAQSAVGIKENA